MRNYSIFQLFLLAGFGILLAAGCGGNANKSKSAEADTPENKTLFGTLDNGKDVYEYTLSNDNGFEVSVINYGGIVTSITAPDKNGKFDNVVLSFDELEKYVNQDSYFGATIGRFGNRIADGEFTLNDKTYELPANDGDNQLHGGPQGFNKQFWEGELVEENGRQALKMTYTSVDGEQGYPGKLDVTVTFMVKEDNTLRIEYDATTTKPTPVNLTNHSYFNLTGDPSTPILDHMLTIKGDHYTPVDDELIPTGEIKAVEGTPFDFTKAHAIGERIDQVEGGYDHNWVLRMEPADELYKAVELVDPASGRKMEIYTVEPGMQFYSGNFLDGTFKGPDGTPFVHYGGMCLEPQHFPNSPNEDEFPSTILEPGEQYHTVSEYRFSTVNH